MSDALEIQAELSSVREMAKRAGDVAESAEKRSSRIAELLYGKDGILIRFDRLEQFNKIVARLMWGIAAGVGSLVLMAAVSLLRRGW